MSIRAVRVFPYHLRNLVITQLVVSLADTIFVEIRMRQANLLTVYFQYLDEITLRKLFQQFFALGCRQRAIRLKCHLSSVVMKPYITVTTVTLRFAVGGHRIEHHELMITHQKLHIVLRKDLLQNLNAVRTAIDSITDDIKLVLGRKAYLFKSFDKQVILTMQI